MPKVELDDVERYMVAQAQDMKTSIERVLLAGWIQRRCAELRFRESAKNKKL